MGATFTPQHTSRATGLTVRQTRPTARRHGTSARVGHRGDDFVGAGTLLARAGSYSMRHVRINAAELFARSDTFKFRAGERCVFAGMRRRCDARRARARHLTLGPLN